MMNPPLWMVLGTLIPTFGFGLFYLWRAVRTNRFDAIMFPLVAAYGIWIEHATVKSTEAYDYPDMLLMVWSPPDWIPVAVGVSWAIVVYVAMQATDRMGIAKWQRPFVDGAMAVMIDLVMDPVTSASVLVPSNSTSTTCMAVEGDRFGGVGMWLWCVPEQHAYLWYNVPYSNFIGWFLVVFVASATIRAGRALTRVDERPLGAQLAIAVGVTLVASVLVSQAVQGMIRILRFDLISPALMFYAVCALPVLVLGWQLRRVEIRNRFEFGLIAFPLFVFVVEPLTFILMGMDRANWPGSLLLLLGTALFGALLFALPYIGHLRRAPTTAPPA
ncbi:MAG: carotenoid biosynthesis protein [Gemmatimonadales bacterium]|nr:carotenoid biosynthesis protein [Gemmatimonadota bacterium]MCL4212955.1 carotenoid biosynthesis protein [Gemmatimonadales bacterium]